MLENLALKGVKRLVGPPTADVVVGRFNSILCYRRFRRNRYLYRNFVGAGATDATILTSKYS